MEDSSSSSTKEVASHGSGTPFSYPSCFHELIRALLSCFGLQNPISCPKQEGDDDGKVDNNQHVSLEEAASAPSLTTGSTLDPPSTVVDPPADPPSTTATGDDGVPFIALFTPKRPGTGGGRGPQIN
ncbi:hypothetical protein HRI_002725400 [Hibiscus trionum]|uniref:Uncharacterized protein n=1 Tax=Hibiscus trionum TaxID=183268 RepID=A0A9W7M7P6_HIBTR|nr:hypothetical protein HRI_002725400 [Hibiscus trionum]